MNEDAYVSRNMRKSIRYKDLHKFPQFNSKANIEAIADKTVGKISSNSVWANAIEKIWVKGKVAWNIKDPKAVLAHNLLNRNLKANYSSQNQDRKVTIDLIISHLKDSYSYCVHRLDIKSFYESFDRRDILKKFRNDSIISKKSVSILEGFFQELSKLGAKGLPRGIGISSVLSEIMMSQFDEKISSLKEVLFYARFVDDIIIITTPNFNSNALKRKVKNAGLPEALEFHSKGDKVFFSTISKASEKHMPTVEFDFLGYLFSVKSVENDVGRNLDFKRRELDVSIASEKVKKIKLRIIKSFAATLSSRKASESDIALLNKRIMFLSKNFRLPNSEKEKNIHSGIYHNYSFIDDLSQLKEIDRFYQSLLFGNKTRLSKRIRKGIPFNSRKGLGKHSFLRGFQEKEHCRFDNSDFNLIKRIWG